MMYKIKYADILKYIVLKPILACILMGVFTDVGEGHGKWQMMAFETIIAIESFIILTILFFPVRLIKFKKTYYVFWIIISLLIINEASGDIIDGKETNIIFVLSSGLYRMLIVKFTDMFAVISVGYYCFGVPILNALKKNTIDLQEP